jgi:signal transduction histidine kinase
MSTTQATFATARINRLIGRALAAASVLLSVESGLNYYNQSQYLNQPLSWILVSILWATTAAFTYTFWFGSASYIYLRIHALYMFVLLAAWPLMIREVPVDDGTFYPFIWWAFDTGWVAAAISFRLRWVITYFVLLIVGTQGMFFMTVGGSHSVTQVLTDGAFTVLTNGSVAVIILMLRNAANATDKANAEAIQVAVLQAKAEAESKERQRLDALIHDSVLTALISATNAKTELEVQSAAELASSALEKLSNIENSSVEGAPVFCGDLFDSVIAAAKRLDPDIQARKDCQTHFLVEKQVSVALTEAILQALQNSQLHAGLKAQRELILKASNNELKIVLKDNGKGFRPNRVPKGRLGIRNSIVGRVQSVGGTAYIVSSPGQGATVILEWSKQ